LFCFLGSPSRADGFSPWMPNSLTVRCQCIQFLVLGSICDILFQWNAICLFDRLCNISDIVFQRFRCAEQILSQSTSYLLFLIIFQPGEVTGLEGIAHNFLSFSEAREFESFILFNLLLIDSDLPSDIIEMPREIQSCHRGRRLRPDLTQPFTHR
jgi:hypothetical protein